jgi:7,8-dihydroneopterin aldolase/epimerase/oxygenase
MSKISIVDLELFCHVGVTDEERARPQRLLITVDMTMDLSAAILSDRIAKTIDYYEVAQRLLKLGEGRSWRLIEKLAGDISDLVITGFQPDSVTVEVKKFPIPQARHVAVTLTRSRVGQLQDGSVGNPVM